MDSPTKKRHKPSRVRKFPSQMGAELPLHSSTEVVPGSQGGWDGMDGDPQRSGTQGAGSKVGKGEGGGEMDAKGGETWQKKTLFGILICRYLLKNV